MSSRSSRPSNTSRSRSDRRRADPQMPTRVLVLTGDPIAATMAGPAIRAGRAGPAPRRRRPWRGARGACAGRCLRRCPASRWWRPPATSSGPSRTMPMWSSPSPRWWRIIRGSAAVVRCSSSMPTTPGLLETLERRRGEPVNAQRDWAAAAQRHLVEPLRHADVVMVASDRQRHLTIGILAALGRLTPRVVAEDPTLERLVPVVPFGTPAGPVPTPATQPDHRSRRPGR